MSKMRIGDLFELEKGSLQSSKCTEGEFDFITASKDWKTHNDFSHDIEALIFAAMASGSLGRTHYVNGKFITSDLCYILTPKDSEKYPINLKFYHFVFNSLRDEIVKNTKSGTSKESINQTNLKKYEIPYFDIEQQNIWIQRLLNTKAIKKNLVSELANQQELLKKLRQSILQEAIEGKLTATWREQNPDVESASVLLEKIKVEKEQLIKDKKIKTQKPLPPINEDEIPFDIPDSWEWCRIDDICFSISSGSTPSKDTFIDNSGVPYLKVYNIRKQKIDLEYKPQYIKQEINNTKLKRSILYPTDVIMNIVGPPLGKIAIIPDTYPQLNCNQAIVHFKLIQPKIHKYLYYFLREFSFLKYIHFKGVAGQDNISITQSRSILFPLPPIEEQTEIVKKIENLFKICDELETQINSSKINSQTLMQAVLKEAFNADTYDVSQKDHLIQEDDIFQVLDNTLKEYRIVKTKVYRRKKQNYPPNNHMMKMIMVGDLKDDIVTAKLINIRNTIQAAKSIQHNLLGIFGIGDTAYGAYQNIMQVSDSLNVGAVSLVLLAWSLYKSREIEIEDINVIATFLALKDTFIEKSQKEYINQELLLKKVNDILDAHDKDTITEKTLNKVVATLKNKYKCLEERQGRYYLLDEVKVSE